MSKRSAVVSLGSSCQTKHQIREMKQSFPDLLGSSVDTSGYPFDWLVIPIGSLCAIIGRDAQFPTLALSELSHEPRDAFRTPIRHLSENFFFWHDFQKDKQIAIDETFDEVRGRYEYLWRKFSALESFDTRIFVISNTQNNLDQIATAYSTSFLFDAPALERLRSVLDSRFSRGENRLVAATYRDRFLGPLPEEKVCTVLFLDKDDSKWEGDTLAWKAGLAKALSTAPA